MGCGYRKEEITTRVGFLFYFIFFLRKKIKREQFLYNPVDKIDCLIETYENKLKILPTIGTPELSRPYKIKILISPK